MPEQKRKHSKPESAETPAVSPGFLSVNGEPATGLDARLAALGVPADVLAEVRALTRTNGAGMVDLLLQKKVISEADLLSALSAEYGIPFWKALPTDHMNTDFTGLVSIQYLKKQKIVPLDTPQGFVVAVNDPFAGERDRYWPRSALTLMLLAVGFTAAAVQLGCQPAAFASTSPMPHR